MMRGVIKMGEAQERDPKSGRWLPAIPEPVWTSKGIKGIRLLFRGNKALRPQCLECLAIFDSVEAYKTHYRLSHQRKVQS